MRCLVTGGAGFIGSHLVERLIENGHSVLVVDDLSSGSLNNLPFNRTSLEFFKVDINEAGIAEKACTDVDYIFHLAAIASVQSSMQYPMKTQQAGEVATLRLLHAAASKKVKRFILASSASVYGNNQKQTEDQPVSPVSPYAASKAACENYVKAYSQSVDGVSLRFFNIFGPRQDPSSPYSGVISIFAKKIMDGIRPTIYGDGLQSRDFTFVDNVVHACILAMGHKSPLMGEAFNIGCGMAISVNDLTMSLNKAMFDDPKRVSPFYANERTGDVRYSCANISKAKSVLDYSPTTGFSAGIERLVKYYRTIPSV